ncbi:hypothetical protein ABFX02_11G099300 [Erythranthe guttata]
MRSSNNLILSALFLMMLLFINDIGLANGAGGETPRMQRSQTYKGFMCIPKKCKSACKGENWVNGFCAGKILSCKKRVCFCSNI